MAGRRRHIKVYALFASPVSPRAKCLSLCRVKDQPVDIVGRGAPADSDNVVILEEHLLPLDFIFENVVNASM